MRDYGVDEHVERSPLISGQLAEQAIRGFLNTMQSEATRKDGFAGR